MNEEQLNDIFKAIHTYYPVGFSKYADNYYGTKEWTKILLEKHDSLREDRSSTWQKLVAQLTDFDLVKQVLDQSYTQFPSLTVQFELKSQSQELGGRRFMIIDVSLLTPYYTVFFDDRYFYHNYTIAGRMKLPFHLSIVFTHADEAARNFFSEAKALVERFYPAHGYLSHKALMDIKAEGGIPYHIPVVESNAYSAYDLLMSCMYHNQLIFSTY